MTEDSARALEAVLRLTALDERSAELKASLERIEQKLEVLVDRLSKVEAKYEELARQNGVDDDTADPAVASEADPLDRPFLTTVSEE